MSGKVTIQDLMECGVHFGHQVKRWNPKMKEYVYGVRNGIYIIDLTKTMHQLADACNFLQGLVYKGGDILFVGTKRQAQEIVKQAAEKSGMFYISERWLGGTLTNNATIRKSISRMRSIDRTIEKDSKSMTKKELASLNRKGLKLHRNLDGISEMRKLPAALVVVDTCCESIAVKEAKKLKIPIVAIVDTNGNPEEVSYPIPGNDDAIRSIKIMTNVISDSITIAAELYRSKVAEEKAEKAKKRAEEAEKAKKLKEEKRANRKSAPKAEDRKASPKAAPKVEKKVAPKTEEKAVPPAKTAPKATPKVEKKAVPAKAAPKADEKAAPKVEKKVAPKTESAPVKAAPKTDEKAAPKVEKKVAPKTESAPADEEKKPAAKKTAAKKVPVKKATAKKTDVKEEPKEAVEF